MRGSDFSNEVLQPEPNYLRDQIAIWVKEKIDSGIYRDRLPSERQLAEEMEVNRLTVRAALKKLEDDKVIEVAGKRRLILRGGGKASQTVPEFTEVVVLSAEPLEEIYHSHVLIFEMLREKLVRHGFGLSIEIHPRCGVARNEAPFEEMVSLHSNACWLLIRIPPVGQRWFVDRKLPAVVMGTPDENIEIASLDLDYEATCFHSASVLIARGKQSIALIRRASDLIGDERSETGLRRACDKAKIEPLVYKVGGEPTAVIDWLRSMSRINRMPQGIIASDPAIFLSVFSYCYQENLRIPDDVAVICRGDDLLLEAIRPKVARYRVNDSMLLNRLWRILLPVLRNQIYAKGPDFIMPDYVPGGSAGNSSIY